MKTLLAQLEIDITPELATTCDTLQQQFKPKARMILGSGLVALHGTSILASVIQAVLGLLSIQKTDYHRAQALNTLNALTEFSMTFSTSEEKIELILMMCRLKWGTIDRLITLLGQLNTISQQAAALQSKIQASTGASRAQTSTAALDSRIQKWVHFDDQRQLTWLKRMIQRENGQQRSDENNIKNRAISMEKIATLVSEHYLTDPLHCNLEEGLAWLCFCYPLLIEFPRVIHSKEALWVMPNLVEMCTHLFHLPSESKQALALLNRLHQTGSQTLTAAFQSHLQKAGMLDLANIEKIIGAFASTDDNKLGARLAHDLGAQVLPDLLEYGLFSKTIFEHILAFGQTPLEIERECRLRGILNSLKELKLLASASAEKFLNFVLSVPGFNEPFFVELGRDQPQHRLSFIAHFIYKLNLHYGLSLEDLRRFFQAPAVLQYYLSEVISGSEMKEWFDVLQPHFESMHHNPENWTWINPLFEQLNIARTRLLFRLPAYVFQIAHQIFFSRPLPSVSIEDLTNYAVMFFTTGYPIDTPEFMDLMHVAKPMILDWIQAHPFTPENEKIFSSFIGIFQLPNLEFIGENVLQRFFYMDCSDINLCEQQIRTYVTWFMHIVMVYHAELKMLTQSGHLCELFDSSPELLDFALQTQTSYRNFLRDHFEQAPNLISALVFLFNEIILIPQSSHQLPVRQQLLQATQDFMEQAVRENTTDISSVRVQEVENSEIVTIDSDSNQCTILKERLNEIIQGVLLQGHQSCNHKRVKAPSQAPESSLPAKRQACEVVSRDQLDREVTSSRLSFSTLFEAETNRQAAPVTLRDQAPVTSQELSSNRH